MVVGNNLWYLVAEMTLGITFETLTYNIPLVCQ